MGSIRIRSNGGIREFSPVTRKYDDDDNDDDDDNNDNNNDNNRPDSFNFKRFVNFYLQDVSVATQGRA